MELQYQIRMLLQYSMHRTKRVFEYKYPGINYLNFKKTKKSSLTLFYKMIVNHGTKKIQAPSRENPYTTYAAASVGIHSLLS